MGELPDASRGRGEAESPLEREGKLKRGCHLRIALAAQREMLASMQLREAAFGLLQSNFASALMSFKTCARMSAPLKR
jgi:hypothetical protein